MPKILLEKTIQVTRTIPVPYTTPTVVLTLENGTVLRVVSETPLPNITAITIQVPAPNPTNTSL